MNMISSFVYICLQRLFSLYFSDLTRVLVTRLSLSPRGFVCIRLMNYLVVQSSYSFQTLIRAYRFSAISWNTCGVGIMRFSKGYEMLADSSHFVSVFCGSCSFATPPQRFRSITTLDPLGDILENHILFVSSVCL